MPPTSRAVVPRSARKTDHVLAVSGARSATISSRIAPAKVTVTPLAVDPAFLGDRDDSCSSSAWSRPGRPARCPLRPRQQACHSSSLGPKDRDSLRSCDAGRRRPRRCAQGRARGLYRRATAVLLPHGTRASASGARGDGEQHPRALGRSAPRVAGDAGVYGSVEGARPSDRYPGRARRAAQFSWRRTAELTVAVYRKVLDMKVAAVVVSHGHPAELQESLPALRRSRRARASRHIPARSPTASGGHERPLGFGANINQGVPDDSGARAHTSNPDAVADQMRSSPCAAVGSIRAARRGTADGLPGRPLAAVAASLPNGHRNDRCDAAAPLVAATASTSEVAAGWPVEADWMLGGFLLLARVLDGSTGSTGLWSVSTAKSTSVPRDARRQERWYVPAAIVRHEHKAETDKRWLTRRTSGTGGRRAVRPQLPSG